MFTLSLQWLVLALDTSLKAALLALLAAAALRAMQLRDSNVRHRVWTGVLLGMLLLPVLARMIPALRLPLPFKLDGLAAFQLDDLEPAPMIDAIVAQPITNEPFNSAPADSQPNPTDNLASAWPPDQTGDPREVSWPRGPSFRPRNSPSAFPPDQVASSDSPQEPDIAAAAAEQQPSAPPAPRPRKRPIALSLIAVFAAMWLLGSAALLLRLAIGLLLAFRLIRRSAPIVNEHIPAFVRECPLVRAPLTVGLFRPQVLLPPTWRTWSPAQLSAVLAHEQMHIERGDCLVLLLAQINRCLYWFHPLAWWLPQHLASLAEAACDDAVIGSTGDRTAYARHLLDVAAGASLHGGRLAPLGVSMARRCEVETRIHAILDFRRPLSQRLSWTRALLLATAIIPLILLAAALTPSAGQHAKTPAQIEEKKSEQTNSEKLPGTNQQAGPTRVAAEGQPADTTFTFSGVVVNDRGQPVAGAIISLGYRENMPGDEQLRRLAISDEQGHFTFSKKLSDLTTSDRPRAWVGTELLAAKDGYGFGIGPLAYFETTGRLANELTERDRQILEFSYGGAKNELTLPIDDMPIRGRIVDSEGRPVSGANVEVASVWGGAAGSLDTWEAAAKEPGANERTVASHLKHLSHTGVSTTTGNFVGSHSLVLPAVQTTDDGWFTLRGLGRERIAELYVSGSRISSMPVRARSRAGSSLQLNYYPDQPGRSIVAYQPAEFTCVAGPSVPVVGRVTDKRTGQPLAGLIVQGYKIPTNEVYGGQAATYIHALTDGDGRYRLEGLPLGDNQFRVLPPRNSPYLASIDGVSLAAGSEPPVRDVALAKGVLVRGRATDGLTSQPLQGRLSYFAFDNNPHLKSTPGFDSPTWGFHTDAEGRFELPVLPGPGLVAFLADDGARYPRGVGADKIDGPKSVTNAIFFLTVPHRVMAQNFHLLTPLDPPADAAEIAVDLELSPGKSLAGRVVGPTGQPHENYYLQGDRWGGWHRQPRSEFEIKGYDASEGRRLIAFDPEKNLVGEIDLTGEVADGVEIVLRPGGTITGRVVDEGGLPIEGLSLGGAIEHFPSGMMKPSAEQKARGTLVTYLDNQPTLTDKNGHFELKGIVAGRKYTGGVSGPRKSDGRPVMMHLGYIFKDATAKPGQTTDLGNLQIKSEWDEAKKEEQEQKPAAKANEENPPLPIKADPAKAAPATTITGSIVSAQAQPISGASIHIVPQFSWLETSKKQSSRVVAKSDSAGRFDFTPEAGEADKSSGAKLLIVAANYGPEFLPLAEVAEQPNSKISLAADDTPIRGRILTLEGQPVAGAKISVESIRALNSGDLKAYIDIVKAGNAGNFNFDKNLYEPPHIEPTTTDAEGRFQLTGIGSNRVAQLEVVSRTIQHARLNVMTLESEPLKPRDGRGFYDLERSRPPVFGATFDWVAKPSRIIVGTVVDAKTRQPIAGAGVGSLDEAHAKTDENGRFELLGCAKATSYGLLLSADDEQYINGSASVSDTPGFDPIEVTLELTRGTTVTGRIIDQATQKPIDHARLTYFPLAPNARVVRGIGSAEARAWGAFTQSFSSSTGEFSIAVLPGPGFIGISAPKSADYQPATVDAFAFFKKENVPYGVDAPQGFPKNSLLVATGDGGTTSTPTTQYNWVELLNAPDQPELKLTRDIALIAAKNLSGIILGPDGQPLSGATVHGHTSVFGRDAQTLRTSDFTVTRLAPDEKRTLVFRHDAQKLAGQLEISADSPAPARVTLEPWAEVTGRLLDKDGAPMANLEFGPWGEVKDGETRGHLPGHHSTDDQGRFRLTGLVPGLVYSLTAHNVARPPHVRIRLKPGENLELGDIKESHEHLSAIPLPPGEGAGRRPASEGLASAAMNAPTSAPAPSITTPQNAAPPATTQNASRSVPLKGRVVSASGRAVAGAKIYWFWSRIPDLDPLKPRLLATTTANGEFDFTLPAIDPKDLTDRLSWTSRDYLVIIAPGIGPVWEDPEHLRRQDQQQSQSLLGSLFQTFAGKSGLTIRLPPPGDPLKGRLVSIDGKPIAGATVKIRWYGDMAKRPTDEAWRERVTSVISTIEPVQLRDVLPTAKTDADGRFELRDLGANRIFELLVQHDDFQTVNLVARNQAGQPVTIEPDRNILHTKVTLHTRDFTAVLGPSKPLTGRVLDLDTGEPIRHAVVRAYQLHGTNLHSSRERQEFSTRTDDKGNYRIAGLPIGSDNRLVAFATGDIPYVPVGHVIDTTKSESIQQDFRLKRGVWATGRVFDAETNQPFTGQISYYWFRNRELEKQIPGLFNAFVDELYWTDNNGEFRVPVLASRGILAFLHSGRAVTAHDGMDRFPRGAGADEIPGSEKMGSMPAFPTLPHYLMPGNYQRVAEVNPAPGQQTIRVDLTLVASRPFQIRVVDSNGKPVPDCEVHGACERWGWQNMTTAEFPVEDLRPKEKRKVLAFHRDRGLAGGVIIKQGDPQPVEIKLAPAGTLTGRLLDADKQPITDATLSTDYEKFESDDSAGIWADDPKLIYNPSNIPVDKDGRFHLTGLIPGWTYSAHAGAPRKINGQMMNRGIGDAFADIRINPGENKDLGDLIINEDSPNQVAKTESQPPAAKSPLPPGEGGDRRSPGEGGPAAAADTTYVYAGTVLDPAGKPLAGAKLYLCYFTREATTDLAPLATTAADGTFKFSRRRQDFDQHAEDGMAWRASTIVATAEGFGFAAQPSIIFETTGLLKAELPAEWRKAIEEKIGEEKAELKLVIDSPIKGRIVNLEGQPVAGASLSVLEISAPEDDGSLDEWEKAAAQPKISAFELEHQLAYIINGPRAAVAASITPSDADGWLTIRGLGKDRLAKVQLRGATVEAFNFFVRSRPGQTFKLFAEPNERMGEEIYYPSTFTHVAGPSQPVIGQITDAETGRPIAGCVIEGKLNLIASGGFNISEIGQIQTVTDADGRYRLEGLQQNSKAPPYLKNVQIVPPHGTPYLPSTAQVKIGLAPEAITHNVKLRRGVVIRGRALDTRTGQPVLGSVVYKAFSDNPAAKAAPDFDQTTVDHYHYQTDSQGRFEIPVLPGKGVVSFAAMDHRGYPPGDGFEEAQAAATAAGTQNFVLLSLRYHHQLKVVDLAADAKEATVDFSLRSAATINGRVHSADGQLLKKYQIYGATPEGGWDYHEGDSFEVKVYEPANGRHLLIAEPEQNLFAIHDLRGEVKDPFDIKLAPAAIIKGRIIDADGQPLENITITNPGIPLSSPAMMGAPKPAPADRGILPSNIDPRKYQTDKDGRFELRGLIPGLKYTAVCQGPGKIGNNAINTFLGRLFTDVTTKPGQTLDLGDLRIKSDTRGAGASPAVSGGAGVSPAASAPLPPGESASRRLAGEGSVSGVILLPSGKPAPATHVAIVGSRIAKQDDAEDAQRFEVIASGKTDDAGRFNLELKNVSSKTHQYTNLIARADTTGVFWRKLNLDAPPKDLTIHLQREEPVRIRLIDLEGQPAAGAKLEIGSLMKRTTGEFSDDGVGYGGDNPAWIAPLTTDQDGRATIHGLPADHGVWLHLEGGDRFAPQGIAINTGAPEDRGERDGTYRDLVRNGKPGEEIVLPLAPAKIFEGTVRYEDTNEPAPHAKISIWASQQRNFGSMTSVEGKTDAAGHYRIVAKPGIRFGILAYAPADSPYLIRRTTEDIHWENSDRVRQLDVSLPRGVLVRGKVLSAGSKEPVANAAVQFIAQDIAKRPQPKGVVTGWQGIQTSAKDGSFTIAIPHVPGHLLVNHDQGSFVLKEIGSRMLNSGEPGGQRNYAHAIEKIDPAPDAKTLDLSIELQPGATVSGRVVDSQGRPLEDAQFTWRQNIWSHWLAWHGQPKSAEGGRFELKGLAPGVEYPVHFFDAKQRLGATVMLKSTDKDPTVTLQPCGSATVRFLDEQAKPVAETRHGLEFVAASGVHRYDYESQRLGLVAADSDFAANVDRLNHGELKVNAEGRLTLPALIPGATYALTTTTKGRWHTVKEFQVRSGETLDLGDISQPSDDRKSASVDTPAAKTKLASSGKSQASAGQDKASAARQASEAPAAMSLTGSLLLPDGKPAAGASIFAVRTVRADRGNHILSTDIVARATAAADGTFQISAPRWDERTLGSSTFETHVQQLIATAPGYGLAWQSVPTKPDAKPLTLQLVADSTPLDGRIINLEGQPVAGARLRVLEIHEPDAMAFDKWLASASAGTSAAPTRMTRASRSMQPDRNSTPFPGGRLIHPPAVPDLAQLKEVITGPDGRFRIPGLGANRKITLVVEGENIAKSWIAALTRDIPRVPMTFADPRYRIPYIHGAKFDFPAEPTQIVEGTVRDADARTPLAGVNVHVRRLGGSTLMVDGFASATTDAAGRYRLTGLPKPSAGESDALFVVPEKSQPYFRTEIEVPSAAALKPVICDIDLKPAVWISGRVTDKATGKGVPSVVSYYPFLDNPHATKYSNFDAGIQSIGQDDHFTTDANGNFRLPALPGRGVLLATARDGRLYRLAEGAVEAGVPRRNTSGEHRTVYHLFSPDVANSVRAVEIDPAVAETNANIELVPLSRSTLQVLDDQNQPLFGARVVGVYPTSTQNLSEQLGSAQPLATDTADIFGLDLDGRRLVILLHRDRRLGKAIVAEDQKTPSAQLEPCATISGRLADASGKPISNQWVSIRVAEADTPKPKDNRAWGHHTFSVQNQLSDAEGNFKLDLIPPGVRYRVESAGATADVPTVAPGQTIDLGALTPPPPQEK